jgi:ribokinase
MSIGRNSIIVILGANLLLNEDDIKKAEETIRQSKVVVCQLEIRQETVAKTFEIARKHSGLILNYHDKLFIFYIVLSILNPAPMSEKFNRDLLKLADVICPNQSEVNSYKNRFILSPFFPIGRSFM